MPTAAGAEVVAHWQMDEESGASVMHDSAPAGGDNNGTIVNVTTGDPGLVSGNAYTFQGANAYVEVPDNDSLDPGTSPITVTATVRPVNMPMPDDSYDLVRKGYSTTKGGDWKMEIKRNPNNHSIGRLHCSFKGVMPNGRRVTVARLAQVDIVDGKAHTVQCVRTATAVHAIVDGRTFTKSKVTGHISNDEPIIVGAKLDGDDVLQGTLDEVVIDIESDSAAEEATEPKVASGAELISHWRMDEGAGASVMHDSASAGGDNDGTIVNATTGLAGLVSGNAYSFQGTNAYVRVPDNDSLDPGTSPITVTATVRPVNGSMPDDSYDLVRKGYSTTKGGDWKMEIKRNPNNHSVGRLHCSFKGVMPNGKRRTVARVAQVDIVDGRTHTVQCVRTATAVHAIVDGRTFTKSKVTGHISNSEPVFVGAKMPGDDVLQGTLDEVTIHIG